MTTQYITFDMAKAKLEELASQFPDKLADCHYADKATGDPQCIVGHALHFWGYTIRDLVKFDEAEESNIDTLMAEGFIDGDGRAASFMGQVQRFQDCGCRWSEAVRWALKEI